MLLFLMSKSCIRRRINYIRKFWWLILFCLQNSIICITYYINYFGFCLMFIFLDKIKCTN